MAVPTKKGNEPTDPKIERFRKYIMPMILDGYLDVGEERECMMEASNMGLDAQKAQEEIERLCHEKEAVLERLAKKDFKEEVRDVVDDKFMDNEEYKELLQKGLKLFADAEKPKTLIEELIVNVLAEENAMSEQQFREMTNKMLAPYVSKGHISVDDWDRICKTMKRTAEKKGIDVVSNELPEIFDDIITMSGLKPSNKKAGGGGNNSLILILVALVAVVGILAVVFGGGNDTSTQTKDQNQAQQTGQNQEKTNTKSFEYPTCDEACASKLKGLYNTWNNSANNMIYVKPKEKSVCKVGGQIRSICKDYNELPGSRKEKARELNPAFEYCELDNAKIRTIAKDYLRWAKNKDGGIASCEWVRRCLSVIPNNSPCSAAKNTFKCSFEASQLTDCQ